MAERSGAEAPDSFNPNVLQILVGLLCSRPVQTVQVGHGEHSISGCSGNHLGYPNKGMAVVQGSERLDIGSLVPVVQFLGYTRGNLVSHLAMIQLWLGPGDAGREAQEGGHEFGVRQVMPNGVGHTRILNLDRDLPTVMQGRPVHLADRCRSDGIVVEDGEQILHGPPQVLLQGLPCQERMHWRCVGL
ncbi:Uncharacterised protein [Mycobacteroides abscessus subsp. abscessus]|nr:Uncharacterised protein [Mycobacteroides abscessus subsp. abscessus]